MKFSKQSWADLGITLAATIQGFLLALGLASCGGSPGPRPPAVETVRGVRVETLRSEIVPDEIEVPGTITAAAAAQVAARAMGTVMQVATREGDHVKRGQLLVLLDERELVARRNAARAALEEAAAAREEANRGVALSQAQADVANKTYERFVFLHGQKSVSPQEFDEVEAKHRAALAGLEQAKARRQQVEAAHARAESEARAAEAVAGYARVAAPFDGVLVRRMVEPGSMVAPGTPLLIVEDTSRYRMEVSVPASAASDATRLRKGSPARVRLDALPGRELAGQVVELEAGADPASQTLRARIELPRDAGVRSGWFGRAWFRRGERRALVMPRSAVVERGQLRGVYAVDAGQIARWRLVTLGASVGDRVQILSGLGEGERFVADPGGQELDGRRMEAGR